MSVAMDRALMALSLEEEEEDLPFTMPDLPGFSSAEENALSLMGRLLNPECQKMSGLILTMPRKWQKEGRVRGVALSQEKFQFIFTSEHDLLDVLEKGVQTYNEWVIVLERWMENPPDDYLQYIPLWVQISKIPVNYYTQEALMALGEMIGEVKVVAFDPSKPITQDFIRVQVKFDVAKPLRMAKVLNMGEGKTTTIHFNYEKIQKRCFLCQRLNHEKSICPVAIKKRQVEAHKAHIRKEKVLAERRNLVTFLDQSDPLFGVLKEDQVGTNPLTGRPKIAPEVLEEMRRYLRTDTGEDNLLKIDKVKRSVREAEMDPMAQRIVLRLESARVITSDLNKGKGLVFDYDDKVDDRIILEQKVNPNKLMAASMTANKNLYSLQEPLNNSAVLRDESISNLPGPFSSCPTVFRVGVTEPCSSGTARKRVPMHRRPPKAQRQKNKWKRFSEAGNQLILVRDGKQEVGSRKRKQSTQDPEELSFTKAHRRKVIPHEGSPPPQ